MNGGSADPSELGALDLHLISEGRHHRLWEVLGAHVIDDGPGLAVRFAVWAPRARTVVVAGDFNGWSNTAQPLERVGESGVWSGVVAGAEPGQCYKFAITGADGVERLHADPLARRSELPPGTASVIERSTYRWSDSSWIKARATRADADQPSESRLSVYEVHLGSWRRGPAGEDPAGAWLGYRESARELAAYVQDLGFTHVELLPVAEHPFGGSWGYQVTGYYSPTARFGSPDDLRAFVDEFHAHGLGVILDWVPGHFPRDEWALANFDGAPLYEHSDPRRAAHPEWGTLEFDLASAAVRNFLIANALYWIEEFHIDGLRVDAVASMLYLDYSRPPGSWVPNEHGGNEDLDAVAFLREVNETVHALHPGVLTIAEESTAWPAVTGAVNAGGLGFTHKWNMGWMHDTLAYFRRETVHRRHHQNEITFGFTYAWSERFVLPLSHDEVVHGKGSLLDKMPGDDWQRFANLRALLALMWCHPGKQLLFMGGEFGQQREWDHDRALDWDLLADPRHAGIQRLVRDLNRVQADLPALWARDYAEDGFQWVAGDDVDHSVVSFLRRSPGAAPVLCIAALTPAVLNNYRVGVPYAGAWVPVLATDDQRYGGSGVVPHAVCSESVGWHGMEHSVLLDLPPLGVVCLVAQSSTAPTGTLRR